MLRQLDFQKNSLGLLAAVFAEGTAAKVPPRPPRTLNVAGRPKTWPARSGRTLLFASFLVIGA